jgi:probable rRNA maturation factor
VSDTQQNLVVDGESLAALARRMLAGEGIARGSLSIALVDDATIRVVNRRHLGHDWPTDVISFGLSEARDHQFAGELVISAERAESVARQFALDPRAELALYLVHGLLHLFGYDDMNDSDAAEMRRREAEILAREGLMNTFPAAGRPEDGVGESLRCSD